MFQIISRLFWIGFGLIWYFMGARVLNSRPAKWKTEVLPTAPQGSGVNCYWWELFNYSLIIIRGGFSAFTGAHQVFCEVIGTFT